MEQKLVEAPRRIMRVTRPAKEAAVAQTTSLEATLQAIAKNQAEIEKLALQQETLHKQMHDLLVGANMQGYTDGEWEASLVNKMSRAGREPDPSKVLKAIGNEAFLGCVKVSVTELKKHMTDREIDGISTLTPATVTGQELKVGRVKRKVKRG